MLTKSQTAKQQARAQRALHNFLKDPEVKDIMTTDRFQSLLEGFDEEPMRAYCYIETCEQMNFHPILDSGEKNWRSLLPDQILELAKLMATCMRNHLFLH